MVGAGHMVLGAALLVVVLFVTRSSGKRQTLYVGGFFYKQKESYVSGPDVAVKHINGRNDLLPGYRLQIIWKNTKVRDELIVDFIFWCSIF